MEELKKSKNETGQNMVIIKTNEGEFNVSFGADHDLYIGFYATKECDDKDVSFTITKEDYYLFTYVEKLYNNIKNKEQNINKDYKKSYIKAAVPFENNQVRWISDDFENENGSELLISFNEGTDSYTFTFKKSKSKTLYNSYFVKIDTIGSYYHPYSDNFVEFYQDLLFGYDYDYHQVHMEEYLFNKSRVRK